MNHNFGLELAKQRQADLLREADLHRLAKAAKAAAPARTTRFPRLLAFRRAAVTGAGAGAGAETPRTRREWRLSRS